MYSPPLPLPQSIQEVILGKLSLEDLCRARAACKYWNWVASEKSFRGRYGSAVVVSQPWFLTMHSRSGFIISNDTIGLPRFMFHRKSWIPTSNLAAIVSTSGGLLLVLDRSQNLQARFTVVNPLTKAIKELPVLELISGEELVYSEIVCSPDDGSYKVFTLGTTDTDEQTGVLYNIKVNKPINWNSTLPDEIKAYKKPFLRYICSDNPDSDTWLPVPCNFPPGFVAPYMLQSKEQQSLIAGPIIYCVTNSTAVPHLPGCAIARFHTGTMEWNPAMIIIPEAVKLLRLMVDTRGEVMLVVGEKQTMNLFVAGIDEQGQVVMKAEVCLPARAYPEDWLMFQMMEVWGFGDSLFLYVPVKQREGGGEWDLTNFDPRSAPFKLGTNVAGEPKLHLWFYNLRSSYCTESSFAPGLELPVGLFASGSADLLKMAYFPSLREP